MIQKFIKSLYSMNSPRIACINKTLLVTYSADNNHMSTTIYMSILCI